MVKIKQLNQLRDFEQEHRERCHRYYHNNRTMVSTKARNKYRLAHGISLDKPTPSQKLNSDS